MKHKIWYQCSHQMVSRGLCDHAKRTSQPCAVETWHIEKLEFFGGTNMPCEHADCVRWNRRLAEMRQEALERNVADAVRHRIDRR
jgi:hypothetical protein